MSEKTGEFNLSKTFEDFFQSEKTSGFLLIACAIASLLVANSAAGPAYLGFWETHVAGMSVSYWVNDGLMAIFFLLIGLELKRELRSGELSDFKKALLPLVAALGGIGFPALIHFGLNSGLDTAKGFGIPMATDIAFALCVLALVGSRAPASLKVFLTAIAVIDDLCAIIVIAVFYSSKFSLLHFGLAMGMLVVLVIMNRMKVVKLPAYFMVGLLLWFFMLQSGIHSTIAGVLLAFTIPLASARADGNSPAGFLEHCLHKPVAYGIMPVFALCNTGIVIGADWASTLVSPNSMGIMAGLLLGKIAGVAIFSFLAVKSGLCQLPYGMAWKHVVGTGLLAGIGFTMSIFITNLAFKDDPNLVNHSIMAVLLASVVSGVAGYAWLFACGKTKGD